MTKSWFAEFLNSKSHSVSELEANDGRICEISGSGSTEGHADKT